MQLVVSVEDEGVVALQTFIGDAPGDAALGLAQGLGGAVRGRTLRWPWLCAGSLVSRC